MIRALAAVSLAAILLAVPGTALASTSHKLTFTFKGDVTPPSKEKVRSCILGTLPKGTVVKTPWPTNADGPWKITTPAIGKSKSELSDKDVENYFNTSGSQKVCPFVESVDVS